MQNLSHIAHDVLTEIISTAGLTQGALVIIGCSTSEVHGAHIGSSPNEAIAEALFTAFSKVAKTHDIHLVFQCCEHLNRAVVIEGAVASQLRLDPVKVIPISGAGGAMAAYAYKHLPSAVVVESIEARADAGLDIGDTLIGMHIHPVVVPLRLQQHTTIGEAHLNAAYSRLKLIGGSRAVYDI